MDGPPHYSAPVLPTTNEITIRILCVAGILRQATFLGSGAGRYGDEGKMRSFDYKVAAGFEAPDSAEIPYVLDPCALHSSRPGAQVIESI